MPKFALSEIWKLLDRTVDQGLHAVNKPEKYVTAEYDAELSCNGTLGVDKDGNIGFFGRLAATAGQGLAPEIAEASVESQGDLSAETHTDLDTSISMSVKIKLSRPALKTPE